MTEPAAQSPLLPLPWAVWVLLLPIAAVEAVLQAAALGWIGRAMLVRIGGHT